MLALALLLLTQPPRLVEAVSHGNLAIARALLGAGADPNSRDSDGESALIYAAFDNRADLAALLLSYRANVNALWGGSAALDFAVSRGSLAAAQLLIDAGSDVRRIYPSGRTPLHLAALSHHTEMAGLLIDRGADIDAPDISGSTPLLVAVRKRFDDLTALLLEAGADPLRKNKAGLSPLECAAGMHRPELTRQLLTKASHPPDALLSEAVRKNRTDLVETLLASGMNGSAALHDAALSGRTEILKTLLQKGADVNHRNATGATPLHDAAMAGKGEAVRILLEHGADVNARETESGDTPLYMAAAMGRDEVTVLLLAGGADPNLASKEGGTPLHAATKNGFMNIAETLRSYLRK
jgi:ankyrin repeat protein